ncbi:MAG: hypothetical protein A2942_03645 [Candidatus Lloydbacteria bacterium RIFCSPLOWO2_01_FULL_50_20]|uniref:Hydrolase TatD n=1 Tax=Candidatus Lloydbacteria bacterium RIFCSPLOWO2_01_FULL_50_20 TaxID=1798665 RepID=A0A1G2DE91_9BACT|nr:MAG: hypothetical protein A2942_03645 [Candidatus Lloydbacteria bacterium RIFCSPLOWO2_01_FULL_50_20]
MTFRFIDIHSHLNDKRYTDDLPEVLARMREANVASIVVGTDRRMSERAIVLAEEHDDLWATIGQHPTDNHAEDFDDAHYIKLAAHPRVVAIGECGLDYHWPAKDKWPTGEQEEKKRQEEIFERQIAVAEKAKKPLMIHGRPTQGTMDAYDDILRILQRHPDTRGNVHFFVGDNAIAKRFLDLGWSVSFTGVLTFTRDYDEVVGYIPLGRIMAETDAPYVAPASHRGKRNEPVFVVETVAAIAKIRNEDEQYVQATLLQNASEFFKLRLN